jgi:hypothetical protein
MTRVVDREVRLSASPEAVWRETQRPALLEYVASPLVRFRWIEPPERPEHWPDGGTVRVRSYLFGFLPMGERVLVFERIDDEAREIQTREHDPMIRRWDHLITVRDDGADGARYRDRIEIDAGLLTLPVWLFAQWFYWHRQRRWRRVAKSIPTEERA